MATARYHDIQADIKTLLNTGIGPFLTDITDGRDSNTPSAILGHQLSKSFAAYYRVKEKLDLQTLDCAILALAKSGKSTLLSALAGAPILPSNNVPETARIVSIEHTQIPEGQKPSLIFTEGGKQFKVEGEDKIRAQLSYLNSEVRTRAHRKEDENLLTVNIQLAALEHEETENPVRLRLLDTPGPNEAGEVALKHQVERLLDSVDAVVYVLDYTKLKTAEEEALLGKLRDSNPQLVQRLAQRLFFVVNKVDLMYTSEGLQEEELRQYVAGLVTAQLNTEGFQLSPDQVMLVSAHDALLARLVLLGKAGSEDRKRFAHKAWGRRAGKKSEAEWREEALQMFEDSNLPDLETSLLSYLYNHAGALKLGSALDGITGLLLEVQNVAVAGQAALQQSAQRLQGESLQLQSSLNATLQKFEAVEAKASIIEQEVVDNVRARMQTLKERLFAHVAEIFEAIKQPTAAPESVKWNRPLTKLLSLLPGRSSEAEQSAEHFQKVLKDVHEDINQQIEAEIREFWHDLELSVNEKQTDMFAAINNHLTALARDIESVVGQVLDLQLDPVDMRMAPPTAQEFHESLQDLFGRGIGQQTRVEEKTCVEEYTVWEKRYRGLCRSSEYYVGQPAQRTVQFNETVTSYKLKPEAVQEYFSNHVGSTVEYSVTYIRDYVRCYLSDHIRDAKARIWNYSKLYTEMMNAALQTKTQSAEEQAAGVRALQVHIEQVRTLLDESSRIMQSTRALFPAADTGFCWVPEADEADSHEVEEPLANSQAAGHVLDSAAEMADIVEKGTPKSGFEPPVPEAILAPAVTETETPADSALTAASDRKVQLSLEQAAGVLQELQSARSDQHPKIEAGTQTEAADETPFHFVEQLLTDASKAPVEAAAVSEQQNEEVEAEKERIMPANEKAVQADSNSAQEQPLQQPSSRAAPAEPSETLAEQAGAAGELPPAAFQQPHELERFLWDSQYPQLPVSRDRSALTDDLGVISGSTVSPASELFDAPPPAILHSDHQEHSDGGSSPRAQDLRESAILRAASEESEWEHVDPDSEQ